MTNTLKIYGYRCPADDDVMPTDLAQECQNDEGFAYTDPLVRLKDVRELIQKGGSREAAGWQPIETAPAAQGEPVGRVKTVGGYPDESEHTVEWLCKYRDLKDGDLLYTAPAVQGEPVATIHVDGSFVHVAWRIPAPSRCAMDVYTAPQPAPDAALVEAFDAGRRAAQEEASERGKSTHWMPLPEGPTT